MAARVGDVSVDRGCGFDAEEVSSIRGTRALGLGWAKVGPEVGGAFAIPVIPGWR